MVNFGFHTGNTNKNGNLYSSEIADIKQYETNNRSISLDGQSDKIIRPTLEIISNI